MVVQKLPKILERVFNRHYKPIKDNILKNSQSEARQKVIKQAQLSLTYRYEYYKSHVYICSKLFLKKIDVFQLTFLLGCRISNFIATGINFLLLTTNKAIGATS